MGGGGGVEVLGGGHAPRTFAPAKNEMPNEKLNCVTRWQDSGVGAAVSGLEKTKTQTQISCILHSTYQSLNPLLAWRDEYLLRALTANYLQVFPFFDIFNWV